MSSDLATHRTATHRAVLHRLALPFTALQEALVNALVRELATRRGFTQPMFKQNHPGGALGISL